MREIVCDRYLAADGPRELVLIAGADGSRLLVDRSEPDHADARLLAHLASDEPDANARLVCRDYLHAGARHARALTRADLRSPPRGLARAPARGSVRAGRADRRRRPSLRAARRRHAAELRWTREARPRAGASRRVSARDVVGALEDYEPVCALTRSAVARFRDDRRVSVATLAVELRRVETSPIVLNRKLREAVLAAVRDAASASARSRWRAGASSTTSAATTPARRAGSRGASGCSRRLPAPTQPLGAQRHARADRARRPRARPARGRAALRSREPRAGPRELARGSTPGRRQPRARARLHRRPAR